jgi:2-polyprenyl-3-methyl-5-hydroxy-6-metoxy-1,4-benzoquinol methylase
MSDRGTEAPAFADQMFASTLGYFDILSMYLGLRLGLYGELARGPATPVELAERAGVAERYAREWLEQQASRGILHAEVGDEARFTLPAGHAEALLDGDSLSYVGATVGQLMSLRNAIGPLQEAYRTGAGVPADAYGAEAVQGQGGSNRPTYLTTLPNEWLPSIPPIHDRLHAGPARVADIGCGTGWSSVAIARTYPLVTVDGFEPDELSVTTARTNADAEGLADRVRFHHADGATVAERGPFDVAAAFECIHDMARPVEVLRAAHEALVEGGSMLIVDERTKEAFTGEPDDREAYYYGWSILDCLPAGMYEQPSAGTGTVMRPSVLRRYAEEAGFAGVDVLPIEHDAFRLYLLRT